MMNVSKAYMKRAMSAMTGKKLKSYASTKKNTIPTTANAIKSSKRRAMRDAY